MSCLTVEQADRLAQERPPYPAPSNEPVRALLRAYRLAPAAGDGLELRKPGKRLHMVRSRDREEVL